MLSALFAFAAAFASALTVVTQHVASTAAPADLTGWRLAPYLIRNPLWLFGLFTVAAGFVSQALALHFGRMSVVQSILITELVFSLVIGRVWLHRLVRPAAWIAASVTVLGLTVFLIMSQPDGGHPQANRSAWLPALLTLGGATVLCVVLASRGSPVRRAALYGSASAIVAATLATFLKSTTETLTRDGIPAVVVRGPLYGLVIAMFVSTVLTQAALHYGPLAVSQPLMVIVDPFVSILLGIWLYGERFTGGPAAIAGAAAAFAAMIVGVVLLARTAPSFDADPPTAADRR